MRLRDSLSTKFAESVYYGFWFAPEFEILRSLIDQTQETVTGDVRLKLYKGNVIITGRKSPNSLSRASRPSKTTPAHTTSMMPKGLSSCKHCDCG